MSEIHVHSRPRRLVDWINPTGARKVHSLIDDKICREDILRYAYQLAKANAGAPGVDAESLLVIEQQGSDEWLAALRQELIEERYRPRAVRTVKIPKANGGERKLGIPTVIS